MKHKNKKELLFMFVPYLFLAITPILINFTFDQQSLKQLSDSLGLLFNVGKYMALFGIGISLLKLHLMGKKLQDSTNNLEKN